MATKSAYKVNTVFSRQILNLVIVKGNQRTYLDLEDLTVDMFNNDPVVKAKSDLHPFTHDSWTEEVILTF